MATTKEIVEALRCASTTDAACKKFDCPYFSRTPKAKRRQFYRKTNIDPKRISDDFWDECDVERISNDAAELIEELAGLKEPSAVTIIS